MLPSLHGQLRPREGAGLLPALFYTRGRYPDKTTCHHAGLRLPNKQRCCQERGCFISLVKRRPLITFFVLTYVLTWAIESPFVFLTDSVTDTQGLVLSILSANVPSAVAIVLTAMVFGRGSLRKLLGRLLIWRVNPFWYLVVILGPAALTGGVVGLNALLGGPP
jgi:CAAX protease family protein